MALYQLDTENADRDISSLITVLTHTPTVSGVCMGLIKLGDGTKNLDGTGGDFQLVITVGGQTVQPSPQTMTFSTAVRGMVWTTPFPVVANDEVIMRVLSPNAADTDVDVTAYLYDTTYALPAAAADAAGGLPISDAGALDIDTLLGYLTAAVATAAELAKVPKSDAAVTWNATALASINAEVDTALTSLNDIAASDILGTALTESYGEKLATRTLTQLLYEIKSMLTNHAISGTTWTTKKLDGTTTAKTYTLNNDAEPSSCVEAS